MAYRSFFNRFFFLLAIVLKRKYDKSFSTWSIAHPFFLQSSKSKVHKMHTNNFYFITPTQCLFPIFRSPVLTGIDDDQSTIKSFPILFFMITHRQMIFFFLAHNGKWNHSELKSSDRLTGICMFNYQFNFSTLIFGTGEY